MLRYILDAAGEPIVEPNLMKWAAWYQRFENRRLVQEHIGDVHISTVFLGLDHSFGDGLPVLWETMIFGGERDGFQERYETRDQALTGHAAAMSLVRLSAEPNEMAKKD